jgi:hypothetical protein
MREAQGKGSRSEANPGKKHKPLSEKQIKTKGLGVWLKWENARPVNPKP